MVEAEVCQTKLNEKKGLQILIFTWTGQRSKDR
jgi:hypothetical protein